MCNVPHAFHRHEISRKEVQLFKTLLFEDSSVVLNAIQYLDHIARICLVEIIGPQRTHFGRLSPINPKHRWQLAAYLILECHTLELAKPIQDLTNDGCVYCVQILM